LLRNLPSTAMPRPTSSVPGGPVAKIEVPPGWYTNIILVSLFSFLFATHGTDAGFQVSRQAYPQVARVRYDERGVINTRYFTGVSGTSNKTMKDLETGVETYAIAPQEDKITINFTFFYSKDPTMTGKKAAENNSLSSQLYIVPVRNFVYFFIVVFDTFF